MNKKNTLTVILTLYKRPFLLERQLQAIENQTVKPDQIILWVNNAGALPYVSHSLSKRNLHTVVSNENMKFFARFTLGLCNSTEYTAVFDDDTIPGNKWLENCFETMTVTGDAILGSSGILLHGKSYVPHNKIGTLGEKLDYLKQVDLVGHAWFLRTENLKYLWYERPFSLENGEDITLSYLAQKYGNLKTFVPPHPPGNKSLHGSLFPELGGDIYANHIADGEKHTRIRDQSVKDYISKGWQIVNSKRITGK